ncbi:MAG: alanine--glyoxylate aminotransferase family protein [Desulfovibrionaceae bacterium]|nr:alanine--glyoxylate aminotransferase family protein [Desulfovibrionaceae bacterium]
MLNKNRLLTPGPTPLPEEVRLALAQDMIHHRKAAFHDILRECEEKLQVLFGTSQPVLPLSCSGSGAMTAAVYSLFTPGEKVLVVNAGKFGERWTKIAASRGLEVLELTVEWGLAVAPEDVEHALDENPDVRGVLVQLSETSTGVLHPVREIGAKMAGRDVLLVVDGVSGVSLCPCPMDEWGIDCLVTGSQKGLMLPPGLALLALSERAWKRCADVTPGCFYFNLPAERKKLEKFETNFTSPVNLLQGLKVSMDMLLADGLDAVFRKQWALTQLTRRAVQAMGLTPFARTNYTWGLTSILLPDGVDGGRIVADCAEKYGAYLAGGQDALKGRIVRLAHMGWLDWSDILAGLYALNRTIIDNGGFCGAHDFLEQGMASYRAALEGEIGVEPPLVHD